MVSIVGTCSIADWTAIVYTNIFDDNVQSIKLLIVIIYPTYQIFCGDDTVLYTDAEDERFSNWVRWVNTPNKQVDENIRSYQYQGQRHYITSKPIQPGTELLVSYGTDYALHLGIDMDTYYSFDGVGKNIYNLTLTARRVGPDDRHNSSHNFQKCKHS